MANIIPALFTAFDFLAAPGSPTDDAVGSPASSAFAWCFGSFVKNLSRHIHGSLSLLS